MRPRIAITTGQRGSFGPPLCFRPVDGQKPRKIRLTKSRSGDNPSIGIEREAKMFAVIKTGGKQYRVAPDDKLKVARLDGEPGSIVELTEVLMVGGDTPALGNPVPGATVAAEVV